MNDENTNIEQQPANSTPEAEWGQGGKMFTQDEVNRIVSDRLTREREKAKPSQVDEREEALKAREARMDCREYLGTKKYPAELLEVLDSTDPDRFKQTVDTLVEKFPGVLYTITIKGAETVNPPANEYEKNIDADLANAFKPKI